MICWFRNITRLQISKFFFYLPNFFLISNAGQILLVFLGYFKLIYSSLSIYKIEVRSNKIFQRIHLVFLCSRDKTKIWIEFHISEIQDSTYFFRNYTSFFRSYPCLILISVSLGKALRFSSVLVSSVSFTRICNGTVFCKIKTLFFYFFRYP